jgi:hypothetical protein
MIAAHTPELDRVEHDAAEADREARIECRCRLVPPSDTAEGDRLAEVARLARLEDQEIGELMRQLMRVREYHTDMKAAGVTLPQVTRLVSFCNEMLDELAPMKAAADGAWKAAEFASKSFDVREWGK